MSAAARVPADVLRCPWCAALIAGLLFLAVDWNVAWSSETNPAGLEAPFAPEVPPAGTPRIYYTDIESGPNSGGENNLGAYLSIFGKGFGSSGLGSRVKVTIGGVEVASYLFLGISKAREDIQQITVQVGSLGHPSPGTALPIRVTVDGNASNTDRTFTVNPGRMLYVDKVKGNDATAAPGDVTRPFRNVQKPDLMAGAFGKAQPGDIIILRGGGTPWSSIGFENYFLRFFRKSGTAPTGWAGSGPITVMGYPREDVLIEAGAESHFGAIAAVNGITYPGDGQWITIADLRIEGGGHDGAINLENHGNHWRVVNNDLSAVTAQPTARAGGIVGNGKGSVFVGNHIHDVAGDGQHNHGIYIDGDGSYEIAYNVIERISGGNGLQLYSDGRSGSDTISNVSVHHNLIRDVAKHGINIADGAEYGIAIFNNVITDTDLAGLRFNTRTLHGCRVFNNTFYATNRRPREHYGAIMNDWILPPDALDLRNNLFVPSRGGDYAGGTVGFEGVIGTVANNLWFGVTEQPRFDASPLAGDPRFVSPGTDLHLRAGSSAIGKGSTAVLPLVTTDFDIVTARPAGGKVDVGAFAFR